MKELKQWLINHINNFSKEYYNESTYIWSKGYKKACIEILEIINKIESKSGKGEK